MQTQKQVSMLISTKRRFIYCLCNQPLWPDYVLESWGSLQIILFMQHVNEGEHLIKCLRVLLILPESLSPSIKTRGELDSSLETSLLSSFFRRLLSSCGCFHLNIQETYPSSRVQDRPLVLSFPCPFPTSIPSSLLQLPETNRRNYPWFLFPSLTGDVEFINTFNCFCTPTLTPHHLHCSIPEQSASAWATSPPS